MTLSITNIEGARSMLSDQGKKFVRIPNPSHVYPPFELCPLAPPLTLFSRAPVIALMDMDGTTTTTETLCLHGLEHAIRQAMGREGSSWEGLDPKADYPHIIGNSTTRHVEYLVDTYGPSFSNRALATSWEDAARRTLEQGRDPMRREEVTRHVKLFGKASDDYFTDKFQNRENRVRAIIDIYYQRYHEILSAIAHEDRDWLLQIPGTRADKPLIEPMPGVGLLLALLKGITGDEAGSLAEIMIRACRSAGIHEDSVDYSPEQTRGTLEKLGRFFSKHPVTLALVTSSIRYEADIVMKEVFRVLQSESAEWPVSTGLRKKLHLFFSDPGNVYDTIVTASDSNEMRLKPHRDLYSMALHQCHILPDRFDAAIGFEDSQSGTIAIRAAGVGRCIALPFQHTDAHSFDAASVVAKGGIPEVLLKHRFFLDDLL